MYFILVLYSYAGHLRSSTYHALPFTSRSKATQIAHPPTADDLQAAEEHDELEEGASNGDAVKAQKRGKEGPNGHGGEEDFSWD